jgi:hypothetical protein
LDPLLLSEGLSIFAENEIITKRLCPTKLEEPFMKGSNFGDSGTGRKVPPSMSVEGRGSNRGCVKESTKLSSRGSTKVTVAHPILFTRQTGFDWITASPLKGRPSVPFGSLPLWIQVCLTTDLIQNL